MRKSRTHTWIHASSVLLLLTASATARLHVSQSDNAAAVSNGTVQITALLEDGRSAGFGLIDQKSGTPLAQITLGGNGRWTARCSVCEEDGNAVLRFSGLDTGDAERSPEFTAQTSVTISLPPQTAFPIVTINLAPTRPSPAIAPETILTCRVADADVFYRGGLQTPLHDLDPVPLRSPAIRGRWSEGWAAGIRMESCPVPALGLWAPRRSTFVGYCFRRPPNSTGSGREIETVCRISAPGESQPLFGLLLPASGANCEFVLLHSSTLPSTRSPNAFILHHIWDTYREWLPPVAGICDLGWMPERDEFVPSPPEARELIRTPSRSPIDPESVLFERDAILPAASRYQAVFKAAGALGQPHHERLMEDWEQLKRMAVHTVVDGDECTCWPFPLAGAYTPAFGGKTATAATAPATWEIGTIALALHAATKDKAYLPYIDGVLNWTRHSVSTRAGDPRIPWATSVAAVDAGSSFLLQFHHQFRTAHALSRREMARSAIELGTTLIYRHLAVYTGDPNPDDTFDPTFLIQADNCRTSFGRVAWGSTAGLIRAMALYHVETGDPVLGHFARGALQRWHVGSDADGIHTVEAINLSSGLHGPGRQGQIRASNTLAEYFQPIGSAALRVLCGTRAAMAFTRGGRTDVADYTTANDGSFGFRLAGSETEEFTIIVTSPRRDLRDLEVRVNGKRSETTSPLSTGENLIITGTRVGDTVTVGKQVKLKRDALSPSAPDAEEKAMPNGFQAVPFPRDTAVDASWQSGCSWAGLGLGYRTTNGIPVVLADHHAADLDRQSVRIQPREPCGSLFLFAAATSTPLAATITQANGTREELQLTPGLPALRPGPSRSWQINMIPISATEQGTQIASVDVHGKGLLFAATGHPSAGPAATFIKRLQATQGAESSRSVMQTEETPALTALVANLRNDIGQTTRRKALRIAFLPPLAPHAETLRLACGLLGTSPAMLTPQEAVDPAQLTPDRYPIVVYAGPETFLHTVKQPGDAVSALKAYLKAGGCLVSAAWGWPFYYALKADSGSFPRVEGTQNAQTCGELQIGINSALCPKPAEVPRFVLPPDQPVFRHLRSPLPFNRAVGGGYRLATSAGLPEEDVFTPALVLRDASGKDHGAVVAVTEHNCDTYNRGRTIFLWANILRLDEALPIALELMSYAIRTSRLPPRDNFTPSIAVLPRDVAEHGRAIEAACAATGLQSHTLTAEEFADPAVFNPTNFPVAIHAVYGEYFIDAVRTRPGLWRNYVDYVRGGGFLVACGTMWQFYYHSRLGLDGEWHQKPDPGRQIQAELGFSIHSPRFQDSRPMFLHCLPGQDVITFNGPMDVSHLPWGEYRGIDTDPILGPKITPIAQVLDTDRDSFGGYAAALIRYRRPELRGTELIWLWGNLLDSPDAYPLLEQALRYAVEHRKVMFHTAPKIQRE